jgi:ubiquinone/menaquinone biosynthesis C-methylase UbiE
VTDKKNFYERAGIEDQAEFYGGLYASGELLHPDYFHPLERFHIRWARTMWIYDNVAPNATLLDLGSGAGLLSLLKRKNVKLVGIDLSPACATVTRRNGYDLACTGNLTSLPFADQSFDYVVSLDVMGHIEFEQKDSVISEIGRVLKPNGVTMHGIEIMNTDRRKNYDQMTEAELRKFVAVDGHVGMEPEGDVVTRFSSFFSHVDSRSRFSICQSAEELVKQADDYGVPLCDSDFLDYLRGLTHNERRAFNMAMGYLFQQISDYDIDLPRSEYLFLKASNAELKSFYNEHRDRTPLFATEPGTDLNKSLSATFDGGWYPAENFPPITRWMGRRAKITFHADANSILSFILVTHIPDVAVRPLSVTISINGSLHQLLVFNDNKPHSIELPLTKVPRSQASPAYDLEITADRTWQPNPNDPIARDDREISVAVFDIRLKS